MEYKVDKKGKSEVQITATVAKEDFEKHYKQATEEVSKDLKVKGFRPGHVPAHIVEQQVDKKYLTARAQELAIQRSYAEIVVKEKLQVVARPQVKIESDEPFKYTATVAVMPEIEIKDYKSIKIPQEEAKVTDKDVDEVINEMKSRATTYKDADRAAKNSDRVELDFEGFDTDGKSLPNTKSQNHPIILGSNTMIPGFEEALVGVKKDEEKEFDITFPKDYQHKDFQGKKAKFKVKIHRVEEPVEPELNDEFVEKVSGKKDSIDNFKKEIRKNLEARAEQEAKQKRENAYVEELIKKVKVDLPEALVHEEVHHIIDEMKRDVEMRGMEFEKFLEQSKISHDDLHKKYQGEAEKRLKIRLALQHVIAEEGIKVSDEEIKKELEKVKSFYPPEQHSKIEEDFEKGELKNQILNRLTLRKFFEKVLA